MGRAPCCEKDTGLKKGPWTPEEDQKLVSFIQIHGHGSWRSLPKRAGLMRCGKSCRLRWTNYLRPDIKRGHFTIEEDHTIIELHAILGNKWSTIAGNLPGRTDNEIKNYWNTHLKKRLIQMGIDPVTHRPIQTFQIPANVLYSSNMQIGNADSLHTGTMTVTNAKTSSALNNQKMGLNHEMNTLFKSPVMFSAGSDRILEHIENAEKSVIDIGCNAETAAIESTTSSHYAFDNDFLDYPPNIQKKLSQNEIIENDYWNTMIRQIGTTIPPCN